MSRTKDHLTRRSVISAVAAGPLALLSKAQTLRSAAPRPNIVFILADDLGYADVSCYGRREYKTPNIDSLAADGIKFLRAYANSAVCSATRIALITGRYQYRLRAGLEEPILYGSRLGLPPEHPTLPSLLKKAGYGTTLIGKWHLGGLPQYGPLKSGYDHFWGFRWGALDYFSHRYGDAAGLKDEDLWDGDVKVHENGYLTDLLGDRAVKSIAEYAKAKQPFFLSLHFNAPHWPWEGPADLAESQRIKKLDYNDGGSLKTYGEMVTRMDFQIGRVLKSLSESHIANDTIVVFTSDNGGERFSDTWPFTGEKTELLEGGLRIPALARWPSHIKPGSTTDQVAITMDWMPTLLAAAGTRPDPVYVPDGINLLPQLTGSAAQVQRRVYWRYHYYQQRAMLDGNMKYLRINGNEFLFNISDDPRERANLKDRQTNVFKGMLSEYEKWNSTMLPDSLDIRSGGPVGFANELADHIGIVPPNDFLKQ
jgi:arylsulfatase A-like enzyme